MGKVSERINQLKGLPFIFLLLCLPARADLVLTEEKTAANIKRGEIFSIEVSSNPTTGYTWEKSQAYSTKRLRFLHWDYLPSPEPLLGTGGKEIFTFQALSPGQAKIAISYRRVWEKTKPLRRLSFIVTVE
ncbi:MAG: protease inhibitor I42 family protein [Candidatus Omnitrophica bacterium]|nr:protease inhibitor I42 family protein [Candidatus Omnitrophota bacterium]MCM8769099.1 protease inhibitor I42 family protein [Candidatus Omnitrophota bacterium]